MAKKIDEETSRWSRFLKWMTGGSTALDDDLQHDYEQTADEFSPVHDEQLTLESHLSSERDQAFYDHPESDIPNKSRHSRLNKTLYRCVTVLLAVGIITVLLYTTSFLPAFGNPADPVNNEVSKRYIEQGMTETGAVNIVAGMILDYRAFDTLGESNVLFVAACAVIIMLRISADHDDKHAYQLEAEADDRMYEPKNDQILKHSVTILVPFILLFGAYVILNGHISPGGGFSGGAIMGAGLILYLNAFGFKMTERFFTYRTFKVISFSALTFYAVSKAYSFFTGANHLHSIITPGTPGRIFSAGLIPYLNIAVGLVVCCTMYAFYTLFRKGDM